MGAPDNNMWFGWRVATPTASLKGMTFSDALAKADVWPVASVEASSTQITSFEDPERLDQRLQKNERAAVIIGFARSPSRSWRIASTTSVPTARCGAACSNCEVHQRAVIITSAEAANPAGLDSFAEESEINVALESKGDPKAVMATLKGRGKRMGVSAHLGGWAQPGIEAKRRAGRVKGEAAAHPPPPTAAR